LRQFLEDAGCVVLERVQDIIEIHNSVKVNTVFNGEFVASDKRANKRNTIQETMNSSKHRICISGTSVTSSNPRWRSSKNFKDVTADRRCREFSILQ